MRNDLRDHDNVVECIDWAPDCSHGNIIKAANIDANAKSGPFLVSGARDKTIKVSLKRNNISSHSRTRVAVFVQRHPARL